MGVIRHLPLDRCIAIHCDCVLARQALETSDELVRLVG